MKKKDKIVLGIGLFAMVLTIIIGTSYAYWKLSKVQEDRNIIATGCFNVEFTDGEGISLEDAYPISDEDGLKLTPYTFTIENKCESYVSYQINLETLSQATGVKVLPDEYVRADLQEGTSRKTNSTLNSDIETETTLTEATKAYKLYNRYLKPNESKTYNLRIWMDKDTPPIEEVMNAFYSGKVTIDFSYMAKNPMENAGTLRTTTGSSDTTAFYNYRSNITNVIIQDELNPIETELSWDVSEDNSGKVMSYLVPNGETLTERVYDSYTDAVLIDTTAYTLYLQGDGGIYANPNSSYLFWNFVNLTTIEGLEYLDTSKVTNMDSMFGGRPYPGMNLKDLDVSNFDTSNVTNMRQLFCNQQKITSLDVSNFDTSQVTEMELMFYRMRSLTSLDVSNFDTSNVTTMRSMFSDCNNLTNLNLSNFNFDKVVYFIRANDSGDDRNGFLGYCPKVVTTLNIKNNNIKYYNYALEGAATENGAQITINYTEESSDLVDKIIATKSKNSNVIKGELIPSYNITINSDSVTSDVSKGYEGKKITLRPTNSVIADFNPIVSFKLNGNLIEGDTFIMPNEDAIISDIKLLSIYSITINSDSVTSDVSKDYEGRQITLRPTNSSIADYNPIVSFKLNGNLVEGNTFIMPSEDVTISEIKLLSIIGEPRTDAFYNYRANITKVVFQNELNPIETELSWDISALQNGSVMSYLVPNEDDNTKYTLYLQGNGKIYANKNSANLFTGFNKLTTMEKLEYLDTSKVTNMQTMFAGCSSLTSLDLSGFDISNVTNMGNIFAGCPALETLNISNWNFNKVTDLSYFFNNYFSNLKQLNLTNVNTSNVTNMTRMFSGCKSLTSLDLSSFDISNVTSMSEMFYGCTALENLNISNWNFNKVTNLNGFFATGLSNLKQLNLTNVNFSKVTSLGGFFNGCSNLTTTLDIKDNVITNYYGMFGGAATASGAQIIVNYTAETSDLVDQMIATKSSNSNVVKGSLITE